MDDRAVAHARADQLVAVGAQGGQQRLQPVEGEQAQAPRRSTALTLAAIILIGDFRHTAVSFNPGSAEAVVDEVDGVAPGGDWFTPATAGAAWG